MPEGISENLPPKKPGILQKVPEIVRGVREKIDDFILGNPSMPGSIAKKSRPSRPIGIRVLPQNEEAPQGMAPEQEINTLPDLEHNIQASEQFIKSLRKATLYSQAPRDARFLKSNLGYLVEGQSVEKGWFEAGSVVKTAEDRYQLPLAIYVDNNHAKLLVKGPYRTPEGMAIKVYNPMFSNFQERRVDVDRYGIPIGVYNNLLAGRKMARGEYDLTKFLEAPDIAKHADLLTNIKAFSFQKDSYNCIPYCLFVSAMLHGLEPGVTEFKSQGIKQFEQDFGVGILTREEILPQKPRIRIVK